MCRRTQCRHHNQTHSLLCPRAQVRLSGYCHTSHSKSQSSRTKSVCRDSLYWAKLLLPTPPLGPPTTGISRLQVGNLPGTGSLPRVLLLIAQVPNGSGPLLETISIAIQTLSYASSPGPRLSASTRTTAKVPAWMFCIPSSILFLYQTTIVSRPQ